MAAAAAQSAEIQNHSCTPPSPVLSRAEGKKMLEDYTDNSFVLARDILHFLLVTIFEREENMHDNNLSSENFIDFEW